MVSFQDGLRNSLKSSLCGALSNADKYYSIFQNILPQSPLLQLPSFPGALYGLFCNRDPGDAPQNPDPQFAGGQCACARYNFAITYEAYFGNPNDPEVGTYYVYPRLFGPVQGIYLGNPDTFGSTPVFQRMFAVCRGDAFIGGCQPIGETNIVAGGPRIKRIVSISQTPFGSDPDNCGSPAPPPPNVIPPGENSDEADVEFTDGNDVNVTVPIVLVYGTANINVKGEIIIPVDVQIGPNTLEVDINFNTGDINIGPSFETNNPGVGTGGRGTNCECNDKPVTDGDDEEPGTGVPSPTTPSEKESDDRIIVAAIVTVTNEGNGIGEVNGDSFSAPDIAVPRYGDLMFEVRIGSRTAWVNDVPVKNARCLIPCPWEGGALSVRGIPKPGVAWEITPVYSATKQSRGTAS